MKRLIVIILLTTNPAFAQPVPQPTQFDKFVNRPKIEWAAYASDTFSFSGFNNMLLNRLHQKQIKASLPVDSRSSQADHIDYVSINTINNAYFGEPETKIDTSSFTITEVTQVLYVENGKLKSYIPWVTPTLPVRISTGAYIGERFYFSTAYNYKYNKKSRNQRKLQLLGQTRKMIRLEDHANSLKEMYGRNLLQTLWPQLKKNGTAIHTVYGKQIDPDTIDINRPFEQPQPIPVLDSTGNIIKWVVADESYSGHYSHVQLLQDWYYDRRRNMLYAFTREMYVYATRKVEGKNESLFTVFTLVFH